MSLALREQLVRLREVRATHMRLVDNALADTDRGKTLSAERRGHVDDAMREVEAIDSQITAIESKLRASAPPANSEARNRALSDVIAGHGDTGRDLGSPRHVSVRESSAYPNVPGDPHAPSFFRDLFRARAEHAPEAIERLGQHRAETRDLSSTDSAGGYLVAPAHLNDLYVNVRRGIAPVTTLVTNLQVPDSDTITIPKMDSGTAVARQADNAALQETDAVFSELTATVYTIGGKQDISMQLFDRAMPGVDQIIMQDLAENLLITLGSWVNHGTGSSQPTGITATSNIGAVTYTDASPTVAELWPALVEAVNDVTTGNYRQPTAIVMHPRRWNWFLCARDSSERPYVSAYSPQNAMGAMVSQPLSEGVVGHLLGIPVVCDSTITTTNGGSTNEDQIIVGNLEEFYLWTSAPAFAMSIDEKFSSNQVVVRATQYAAFTAATRPAAVSVISGTGLATPTFA